MVVVYFFGPPCIRTQSFRENMPPGSVSSPDTTIIIQITNTVVRSTDTQHFRWPQFQCCRPACVEQLATAPTTRHELSACPA